MANVIKTESGEINGKKIYCYQYLDKESAKEAGLPEGIYHKLEYDGKNVSIGEVIQIVQSSVKNGTFEPAKMISQDELRKHHRKVFEAQQELILKGYKQQRDYYSKIDMPKNVRQQILDGIDSHEKALKENMLFPDMMGEFKPNKQQTDVLMGLKNGR